MHTISILELRRDPLEAFECRHCEVQIQSSDDKEIAAELCNSCFCIRAQRRKKYPLEVHEKAEINFLVAEPFVKERIGRKFVCAYCSKQYVNVSFDYHDPTEEEIANARTYFDKMASFRELSGKSDKKFKVETFDYANAPKGWTNKILCKTCFDQLPEAFRPEIEQTKQEIPREIARVLAQEKAAQNLVKEKESLSNLTKDSVIAAIFLVIFLFFSAVALFKYINVGVTDSWNAAGKESPFGGFIFILIAGVVYLASIPWLRAKGGGYRKLSVAMSWIAAIAFSLFVISIMPSCGADRNLNSQGELPYYRK